MLVVGPHTRRRAAGIRQPVVLSVYSRRIMAGAGKGLVAGAVGVAVMTLGEKVEQVFTHRPSSFVPAHTLERLLGLPSKPDGQRRGFNWAMHWGQGIALGGLARRDG